MRHILYLIITLCIYTGGLSAQPRHGQALIDSMAAKLRNTTGDTACAKLMNQIAFEYVNVNPDSGLKWCAKGLVLADKAGWKRGQANFYNVIGTNLSVKGDNAGALEAYLKALRLQEEINNKVGRCVVLGNIGLCYFYQKSYAKALQFHFTALQAAEELHNKKAIFRTLGNIGSDYRAQNIDDKALEYELRSLKIAVELNDVRGIIVQTENIGVSYENMARYNEALAYSTRALHMSEQTGDRQNAAVALCSIGGMYYKISGDTVQAQPDSLVPATRAASLEKSIDCLQRGLAMARELNMLNEIQSYAEMLSYALAKKGDYSGALNAYRQYAAAKDSVFNTESKEKIAALETSRALQLKDKDIEIAKLAVSKKRNERYAYIAGISLLLLILLVLYRSNRRQQQSNLLLTKEKQRSDHLVYLLDKKVNVLDEEVQQRTQQITNMRQTIATDFHDQTGNMLAAINRQAAMLELRLHDQPGVLPLVKSIIANSDELYASSKDFIWNLNHNSDNPLVLFHYLTGYGQRFYNQFDISFSSGVTGEVAAHRLLDPFAALNLIYIFKEAMSNIIKHSGAAEVTMQLLYSGNAVTYTLSDNGRWKQAAEGVEHNGLRNIEKRCSQSGFGFGLVHNAAGTTLTIQVHTSGYYKQLTEDGNS